MATKSPERREVRPGPRPGTVLDEQGKVQQVPDGWDLLPPGDGALTRKVKAAGPSWTMVEHRRRRKYSKGIWAPATHIARARAALEAKRKSPQYAKERAAQLRRKEEKERRYQGDFAFAVKRFLDFDERYEAFAKDLAAIIATHATPVGSGTVARTQRISLEEKAKKAAMAWLRHHVTDYDNLRVPRQKGARRKVRKAMAARSRQVLEPYRRGTDTPDSCPLQRALREAASKGKSSNK